MSIWLRPTRQTTLALRRSQTTFGTNRETVLLWLTYFLVVCLAQAEQAATLLGSEVIKRLLSSSSSKVRRFLDTAGSAAPSQIAEMTDVPGQPSPGPSTSCRDLTWLNVSDLAEACSNESCFGGQTKLKTTGGRNEPASRW